MPPHLRAWLMLIPSVCTPAPQGAHGRGKPPGPTWGRPTHANHVHTLPTQEPSPKPIGSSDRSLGRCASPTTHPPDRQPHATHRWCVFLCGGKVLFPFAGILIGSCIWIALLNYFVVSRLRGSETAVV
eukprot:2719862-Prymnesium_polylepis.1